MKTIQIISLDGRRRARSSSATRRSSPTTSPGLAATAINLKRLTTRDSVATNGCTCDEQAASAHLAILTACLRALTADTATTSTTGS
jgi:hypothetical protein